MKDPKVLFPHTSARFWEEHRLSFKAVRLEVRIFELVILGIETAPAKDVIAQPIIHEIMVERLYRKMNDELSHHELQCQVMKGDGTDWLPVQSFNDFAGEFIGTPIVLTPVGAMAFHPNHIQAWQLLDKRTGEYRWLNSNNKGS